MGIRSGGTIRRPRAGAGDVSRGRRLIQNAWGVKKKISVSLRSQMSTIFLINLAWIILGHEPHRAGVHV